MANIDKKPIRLSVAPMMDWTDRHCRYLHRMMSKETLLYTEMVTAGAVVYGDQQRLLAYNSAEHPVALQLGGSDPTLLAQATAVAVDFGYDEVNLNIGCPSDRVQSGAFGAVLMERPKLVADCVQAMITAAQGVEVTVKCRIGVDDQEPTEILPEFLETVAAAGVGNFTIHARKAWLKGLSPKENRSVPPLDYALVMSMKQQFSHLRIGINGGISSLDQAEAFLASGIDSVMIGRTAYHDPAAVLLEADPRIFKTGTSVSQVEIVHKMLPYIAAHIAAGGKLSQITRHMLGLFAGQPGARHWRRYLSEKGADQDAGPKIVLEALAAIADIQDAHADAK